MLSLPLQSINKRTAATWVKESISVALPSFPSVFIYSSWFYSLFSWFKWWVWYFSHIVSVSVFAFYPENLHQMQICNVLTVSVRQRGAFLAQILPSLFATFVKSVKTTKHKLCDRTSFVYIEERKRRSAAAFLIMTMNLNEVQIKVVPYPHRDLSWKDFLFFFSLRILIFSWLGGCSLLAFIVSSFPITPLSWMKGTMALTRVLLTHFITTVIMFVAYCTLMCRWATTKNFIIILEKGLIWWEGGNNKCICNLQQS